MKILFLLHTTSMDGSTLSLVNLMEGLINKGVDVVAAGPVLQKRFGDKLKALGVGYSEVSIAESIYPSRSCLYPMKLLNLLRRKSKSYHELRLVVKTSEPDIIHTNTGVLQEGFKVARAFDLPHIWHLREYQDKDFSWRFFPSKSNFVKKLKKSYVVTVTKDIQDYFGLSGYSKAQTIYNGVCHRGWIGEPVPKEKYFVCVSRISPEKCFEDALTAFASFYKDFPDFRLVILGDGNRQYIDQLKQKATALGCKDAIDWLGYQSDLRPYMQKAKALIVASRCEGFGRMTAEAAFVGCMVIGRNSGGTKEILDETGGYMFNNQQEILQAMRDVASMPMTDYEDKMSYAYQKAQRLYTIEGNVSKIYELYQNILTNEQKS